jgi:protein-S-isoprenylcysteine O-methyltransferase Ste14
MRPPLAILGSSTFFLVAPGFVAGVVPFWFTHWRFQPPLLGLSLLRLIGAALILFGGAIVVDSFGRFALQGEGTPAPVLPTKHLVVTGWYRYVRNPMYVGVAAAILGQGLLFGDKNTLAYGLLIWLAFHLFVVFYEEPTLRSTFGEEYEAFCGNVRRWIPGVRPYGKQGDSRSSSS